MDGPWSRRRFLCLLVPAGVVAAAGCSQRRPAEFELRARDAVTLTVVVTPDDSQEAVYEQSHSLEAGAELRLGEDTLQRPPYDVELRMDGESIWNMHVGTCNTVVVSVTRDGTVETLEHLAC